MQVAQVSKLDASPTSKSAAHGSYKSVGSFAPLAGLETRDTADPEVSSRSTIHHHLFRGAKRPTNKPR
jgi:hypothetical protein